MGFTRTGTRGSHAQFEDAQSHKVTVDMHLPEFSPFLIKSMISQAGLTRPQFYGATKSTAKKINKRFEDEID
jgi:predicted RNA binding protein YcfA (HicA-like mRNA interferase family)